MTLGQLARMSGSSALVLRELEINENGPVYVHIAGRKAGIFSWLCNKIGIDTTTTFEVFEDRIEYSGGSLSGNFTELIPLTRISNLGTGYLKPFLYMVLVILCILLAIPTFGITLILAAVFGFMYWTRKSLMLYFIPHSSSVTSMAFKRSIIEGVALDAETAERIVKIVTGLVEKNTAQ